MATEPVEQRMKRKAIPKKVRFEVFKRDSFTCQYCGAEAPNVVLNCDHIVPVCEGGTNKITNLITACFPCNSGKGGTELNNDTAIKKQKRQLDELQERRNQLEMMMQWHQGVEEVKEDEVTMVVDYVNGKLTGCTVNEKGVKKLKAITKKYPFQDVLQAIDIGFDQYTEVGDDGLTANFDLLLRKLGGICKYMHLDEYDKRKHYIKGIINNRHYDMHPTTVDWLFDEINNARNSGVPVIALEEIAKQSTGIEDAIKTIALEAERASSA